MQEDKSKVVSLVPRETGGGKFKPLDEKFVEVLEALMAKGKQGKIIALGVCWCVADGEGNGSSRGNLRVAEPGYAVQLVGLTAILHQRCLDTERAVPSADD